jgi:hypothetical protein
MSDSVEPAMPTVEQLSIVAADRLVWIRLLEKSLNDIDGVMGQLKNDIQELTQAMMVRDGVTDEEE